MRTRRLLALAVGPALVAAAFGRAMDFLWSSGLAPIGSPVWIHD